MGKDIEMQDAKAEAAKPSEAEKPVEVAPTPATVLAGNIKLIEKAVRQKDTKALFSRIIRNTQSIRRKWSRQDVLNFIRSVLPEGHPSAHTLIEAISQIDGMDTDAAGEVPPPTPPTTDPLPEIEMYAYLVSLMAIVDARAFPAARALALAALHRLSAFNRRTLDVIAARLYFYLSWATEKAGALPEIRSTLLGLHRTAVLRHDDVGQETLLNLLLRDYLHHSLYDQAEALRAKAARPDYVWRSPQQHCRYLFHLGRIRAVQLEYSDAKDCLQQALRKAPPSALGFRAAASRWLVLVRLLLGEVPDRSEFAAPDLAAALSPYFELAHAVRGGDLPAFAAVAAKYAAAFHTDRTRLLTVRLRHNVIRTGLRRINLAYSRISLTDVAAKLGLPSVEDAESIVAKAIRDGGIGATLDHDAGVMCSSKAVDVYATDEPAAAFHARVAFCMDVHNEALRAMRFAPKAVSDFEDATALRERQEQELQAALDDDDMEI